MGRLRLFFMLAFLWVGCKNKSVPGTINQSLQTVTIPSGTVNMYGDTNFTIPILNLEVQQYEVTNAAFENFIQLTRYITTSEKTNEAMVFDRTEKIWMLKKGANWRHPQGPESSIENKDYFPVVQVSHDDACAYCEWLGMRLPYESEWEYIFQIDAQKPAISSNHWQGIFPIEDKGTDGYTATSPVGIFGKGNSGCFDLQGNVWEWCSDNYHENWPILGPDFADSIRYFGPKVSFSETSMYDTLKTIKGGSFLCADNYCKGYTNQIRMHADPKLGYEHIGFRCVKKK